MPSGTKPEDSDRDLYSGLIRLHILHHAVEAPIFGLGTLEDLARHGYRISPGTLSTAAWFGAKGLSTFMGGTRWRSRRRVFHATPKGKQALRAAKAKILELFTEIVGRE